MTFSVVIPTKNRPKELNKFINSLINQSKMPDQIIIIDQSKKDLCEKEKISKLLFNRNLNLTYIHDESINGLVEAKNHSLEYNNCEIISFFDDDIILMEDYFEKIEIAFSNNKKILGANGYIINHPKQRFLKYLFFSLTHIGLFKDNRNSLYREKINQPTKLNVISGGISSWKCQIFEKVKFDLQNHFHEFEDIEFSVRFRKYFPNSIYLIPDAKLYHFHSINRINEHLRIKNIAFEAIKFFKKNKNYNLFGLDLLLLCFNIFIKSVKLSYKRKNVFLISYFFEGIREGISYKIHP